MDDIDNKKDNFSGHELDTISGAIRNILTATYNTFKKDGKTVEYYRAFTEAQIESIIKSIKSSLDTLGGIIYNKARLMMFHSLFGEPISLIIWRFSPSKKA